MNTTSVRSCVRKGLPQSAVLLVLLVGATNTLTAQTTGSVTGQVVNGASGRGIPSAQISLVGTSLGILSQANGRYLMLNVPIGDYTVRVQLIGFGTLEHSVTVTAGGTAVADFALNSEAISLDEVVVTGTAGASRRREIGNSVATVNLDQLQQVKPATNVTDLLQGQVAGLQQFTTEGSPGAGTQIRIRGNNSISQSNTPLIYVDGLRMVSSLPPNEGSQQMTSVLNMINPNDIDRIEVIRGAAATTLYGTEASSGVIQIFTKRGRGGTATWSAGLTQGTTFLTNNSMGPVVGPDETWQGIKPWVNNGMTQKFNASVNGSAGGVTYYLSGENSLEKGVFSDQPNGNDSRMASFRTNLGFQPLGGLNISVNTGYSHRFTHWEQSGDNVYGTILNLLRSPKNYANGNDAEIFNQRTTSIDDHFVGGVTATYNPIASLTNRVTVGLDWRDGTNEWVLPNGNPLRATGARTANRWRHTTITADYVGTLRSSLRESMSSLLSFGFQIFNDYDHRMYGDTEDFSGPGLEQTLSSGAIRGNSESLLKEVNAGFFFQEVLGLNDRLFVTAGLRVDGNSAFGNDYGLQPYPKLSASYVISDQDYWPSWWSVMKLRAAVGESGRAPGPFDALRSYRASTGNEDKPGVTPDNLGDDNLGPERTREMEFGFEGSAFADRVSIDFSYYDATTRDALVPVQNPPSLGFASPQLSNVGKIRNSGIEFQVTGAPVRSDNFGLELTGQFSTNKSEAKELAGQQLQIGASSWRQWAREGSPVPGYFGVKVLNPDAIADPEYASDQFYGPAYPTFNYGLGITVTFLQRFTVYALGEGAGGQYHMNAIGRQGAARDLWPSCDVADPAQQNALWRAQCEDLEWSAWIIPADYFKLRTVSLTAQIPQGWIPQSSQGTFTLAGSNLWKSTKYTGLDPELTRGDVYLATREYYHIPVGASIAATLRVSF